MKVKICGITNQEDAFLCEDKGADALGFIHCPGRARSLPLKTIAGICSSIGPMTTRILVCFPKDAPEAAQMCERSQADMLQVYTLGPNELRKVASSGIGVIRAVKPDTKEVQLFSKIARAILFEQGTPGAGETYDYSKIPIRSCPRAIIAGGLDIQNLEQAKALKPYGLDVSSGVEKTPGKKDPGLVEEFVRRCKS